MSTILVVDDQPSNRELLVSLLGYKGHRVLEAENGVDGLSLTRSERPHLVIADVLMPVMDGYEFVRRVRQEAAIADTPVVFYTANYLEREARLFARSCGVNLIITKPAEPQAILDIVANALGNSPAHAALPDEDRFTREHTRLLTDKLSQKVSELQAASDRLVALVRLSQTLAEEPDSQRIIEAFCRGARDIVGARAGVVAIFADAADNLRQLSVSGGDAACAQEIVAPRQGVFGALVAGTRPRRHKRLDTADASVLPAGHRSLSFIGGRIATASRVYGWLYFVGKLGLDGFTEDDELVVSLMASEVALAYENARRLEQVQLHAAELERRVAERTEALMRSNADLTQFAYVASHDLQEPLRMVASYTELLGKRYRGRLDATADEFIEFAVDGARRMQDLIRDLLAYSRLETSKNEVAAVSLDIVLDRALANLASSLHDAAARITRGPLPVVRVVDVQFLQLFQNLLGNAIKFRGTDPPEIHVEAEQTGDEWIVSVRDNGIGIEPEYQDRIFVIFQRLHTRAEYPGTGIGLAICKRIVERHGGRLWVRSIAGAGATFFFSIPITRTPSLPRTS